MKRKPDSHKGQNGKVMIIGGNAMFHGAPILCSLGAEMSGADLIYPFIPPCHEEVARTWSLNFILQTFSKEHLTQKDVKKILSFSEKADAVVIGPGLGSAAETIRAVKSILKMLKKPTVIDASALLYTNHYPEKTVLTPHRGEFKELTGDEPTAKNIQKWAKHFEVTILVKGPEDIIANKDEIRHNKTGTPLMTVGGSGDVLSGFIGGLIAQGYEPIDAASIAAHTLGVIGENLEKDQGSLRAYDLAMMIPKGLKMKY